MLYADVFIYVMCNKNEKISKYITRSENYGIRKNRQYYFQNILTYIYYIIQHKKGFFF